MAQGVLGPPRSRSASRALLSQGFPPTPVACQAPAARSQPGAFGKRGEGTSPPRSVGRVRWWTLPFACSGLGRPPPPPRVLFALASPGLHPASGALRSRLRRSGGSQRHGEWRTGREMEKQTAGWADGTCRPCWEGQEGHGSLGNLEGGLGEAGKGRESRKRGAWPEQDAEVGAPVPPQARSVGVLWVSAPLSPGLGDLADVVPCSLPGASRGCWQSGTAAADPPGARVPAGVWLEHL